MKIYDLFINTRFSKFWAVSSIFDLLKKVHCPFQVMKTFFSLNRSNGPSKNPAFCTDFKNVHMTFVKSAPKKSFGQKTILPIENLPKS